MGQRMRWECAKPWRPSELKYEDGTELKNGAVAYKPLDTLAKRAREAEKNWLRQNKMTTLNDNPPKKRKEKKPRKQRHFRKPTFDDVTITTLNRMKKER